MSVDAAVSDVTRPVVASFVPQKTTPLGPAVVDSRGMPNNGSTG
jgi:hypothetical protein